MNTNLDQISGRSSTSNSTPNKAEFAQLNDPVTPSADWIEHEHVSAQVQLEAQKFVEMVGTPELAKQAISVVERLHQPASRGDSERATGLSDSQQATAQAVGSFLNSLTALESSLATPVVSGELTEWVTNALRDCEQVKANLQSDWRRIHADLFKNILRENADLSAQVEKLRAVDDKISQVDCDEVISSLNQLLVRAQSAGQDEAKLAGVMEDVVKRAMKFVIAARGQETAIAAWLSEAFNRDLGSGD